MGADESVLNCSTLFNDAPLEVYDTSPELEAYGEFIVFFSGGKDSIACVLHLLEMGVPSEKIVIHHHLVDGAEGSTLMDWPVTRSYCIKFAEAFGLRYEETWRKGGFEAEMLRDNQPTGPVAIPDTSGAIAWIGGKGGGDTRKMFPQVSDNLAVRWCSAYLKVDVGARYLANTARFGDGTKRLVITGERAEESPARAKYQVFFVHAQDKRLGRKNRYLDHWRPVHHWSEGEIWAILERHGVNPHPAYWIGYSRCSCKGCIFLNSDSVATLKFVAPHDFKTMSDYEISFGKTIHRTKSLLERADEGAVMPSAAKYAAIAMQPHYYPSIRVAEWVLPDGAFKSNSGRF